MNIIPLKTFSELKLDEGKLSLLCVECNVPLTAEHYASHGYVTPRPMLVTPQAAAGRKGGLGVKIARGDECRQIQEAGWATHRAWPQKGSEKVVQPQRPMTAPIHRARASPRVANMKKTSACSKKTSVKTTASSGLSRKPRIESVTALLNSMRQQRAERPQPEEYKAHEQKVAQKTTQKAKSKEEKWMDEARMRVSIQEKQTKAGNRCMPASSYQTYQSTFQTLDAEGKPKRLTASERLEASLRCSLSQPSPRHTSTPRVNPSITQPGAFDGEILEVQTNGNVIAAGNHRNNEGECMGLYETTKLNTIKKSAAIDKSRKESEEIKPVPGPDDSVLAAVEGARAFAFRGSENGRIHVIDDESVTDDDTVEGEEPTKNDATESELEAAETMAARRAEMSDDQKNNLKSLPLASGDHSSRIEKIRAAREATAESVRRLREQREMKVPSGSGTVGGRKNLEKKLLTGSESVGQDITNDQALVGSSPVQYIGVKMLDVPEVTTITSTERSVITRPQTARPTSKQPSRDTNTGGSQTARAVSSEFEGPRAEYRKVLRPQSAGRTKARGTGKASGSKRLVRPKSAKGRLTHFTNYTSQYVSTSGTYAASTLAKVSKDDIDHRVRKYRKSSGKEEPSANAKGFFGVGIAKYNAAKNDLEKAVTKWGLEIKDSQAASLINRISGEGRPKVMKLNLDVDKIIQDRKDRVDRKKKEEYQKWLASEEKQEYASWNSDVRVEEESPNGDKKTISQKKENPRSQHASPQRSGSISFQKAGTKRAAPAAKIKEETKHLSAEDRLEKTLQEKEYDVAPPYLNKPEENLVKAANQYMPKPQIESSDPIEVSIFDTVDKSTMALVDYVKGEMDLWQTLGDTDFKIAECKQFVVREKARLEAEIQQRKRPSSKPQQQPQPSATGRAKHASGTPHRYKKLLDMDKECYFGLETERETSHLSMALHKWSG